VGFLVDENLPARLARELTSQGLPSQHVSELPMLRSAADEEIVACAARETLVLVTKDRDLWFVTRVPASQDVGIVVVRLSDRLSIDEQVRIVISAIASLRAEEFAGHVVVVEPGRIRVRKRR
jgi:predicted nuclease of predicted toxin-antitoxin system